MMDIKALDAFLVQMNIAYTTVGVAVGANLHFLFCAVVGFLFCVLVHWKFTLCIRICTVILSLLLLASIGGKYTPGHMFSFYKGGASSLSLKDSESGVDSVSTQILYELSGIFKNHTVYKGETPVLTEQGQKQLQQKMGEYTSMRVMATQLQGKFTYLWVSLCLGLLFSTLCGIKRSAIFSYAAFISWGLCGFIILSYPARIVFSAYQLNILGGIITLGAICMVITYILPTPKEPMLK